MAQRLPLLPPHRRLVLLHTADLAHPALADDPSPPLCLQGRHTLLRLLFLDVRALDDDTREPPVVCDEDEGAGVAPQGKGEAANRQVVEVRGDLV